MDYLTYQYCFFSPLNLFIINYGPKIFHIKSSGPTHGIKSRKLLGGSSLESQNAIFLITFLWNYCHCMASLFSKSEKYWCLMETNNSHQWQSPQQTNAGFTTTPTLSGSEECWRHILPKKLAHPVLKERIPGVVIHRKMKGTTAQRYHVYLPIISHIQGH